jgi:hypothetical protein
MLGLMRPIQEVEMDITRISKEVNKLINDLAAHFDGKEM